VTMGDADDSPKGIDVTTDSLEGLSGGVDIISLLPSAPKKQSKKAFSVNPLEDRIVSLLNFVVNHFECSTYLFLLCTF
jgi:hypothetical protein